MKNILLTIVAFLLIGSATAQGVEDSTIQHMVWAFKDDPRGPYRDIRWFCADGTYAHPRKPCEDMEGAVQRARYKSDVIDLAETNHIFFGQILSKTPNSEFWDAKNNNSRLKQYQLEKYLRSVDDGWILRRGQYYRGAYQVEDEEAWGIDFFKYLLAKDDVAEKQFYLLRQAVNDVPHRGDDRLTQRVRATSKSISDGYPAFLNLRVKIHGQPEWDDMRKVRAFRDEHWEKLTPALQRQFDELLADMRAIYRPVDLDVLKKYLRKIPKDSPVGEALREYLMAFETPQLPAARASASAELLWKIRQEFPTVKSRRTRLALLDVSNALEEIFFLDVAAWQTANAQELMDKICYSGMAAAGTGLFEEWEWEILEGDLATPMSGRMSLSEMNNYLDLCRRLVEWGTGMVRGTYDDVVELYGGFEPLSYGFFDDRIRASVLLNLGQSVSQLGDFVATESGHSNELMGLPATAQVRGLNPGFALGKLVVVGEEEREVKVSKNNIYIFHVPPADLKPVAGIATVTEGNVVSHVQLLARNLAIPNAVLSAQNLRDLKKYEGQRVFFAVSNSGTVIMKPEGEMTKEEQLLFYVKKRSEKRINVPVDKIDLAQRRVLNMRQVDASASGKICGPKAANLGQLKKLFPENVVEGIVLPFGIFRWHMEQNMPGTDGTYWDFLNAIFAQAENMREGGLSEEEVDDYVLGELAVLRSAIRQMKLHPEFVADFKRSFHEAFGRRLGNVPVFVRSDTNMEDLKDFTGSGLNKTLFNVVGEDEILEGIKVVWASPYRERGYRWRQRYLLNPENVFPSILVIPTVDVESSGVVITKGISNADGRDITVAFNWGAGGAVDGQAAESYLLRHDGLDILLTPAREPQYRRLPVTGGSIMPFARFEQPILTSENRYDLRKLAYELYQKFPEMEGPYDVECGFRDGHLWLFQVRPFVENENAMASEYLESITPKLRKRKLVNLQKEI